MKRETEFHRIKRERDNFLQEVTNYCLLGATNGQLADFFGVSVDMVNHWNSVSGEAEFRQAVYEGRDQADAMVAQAFFKRATGYEYESQRLVVQNGHAEIISVTEHVPPDTGAGKFWLTNRAGKSWKDKQTHEHGGREGGAIETELTVRFVSAAPQPMLNVTPVIENDNASD